MAEVGARPKVPAARRAALRAARALFTPLLPDDYLELINPLWSTRELRGRIERVDRETADAVTITIRPGFAWEGHEPGQYLRIGVVVDGVHHWRAYSITSDPGRPDGFISITPKLLDSGVVSPFLVSAARPGAIVRLGGVEGTFTLPDPLPRRVLFISAGSGITPIMSMLRCLERRRALDDVVHLHSARTPEDVIFATGLRAIVQRHPGMVLHERHTDRQARLTPADLEELCPDWRERATFASGPGELLDRSRPGHGTAEAVDLTALPDSHLIDGRPGIHHRRTRFYAVPWPQVWEQVFTAAGAHAWLLSDGSTQVAGPGELRGELRPGRSRTPRGSYRRRLLAAEPPDSSSPGHALWQEHWVRTSQRPWGREKSGPGQWVHITVTAADGGTRVDLVLGTVLYGRTQTALRPIIRAGQAIASRNALYQLGLVLEEAGGASSTSETDAT